ncbi:hypothetical protein Q7P37_002557 [Cladosporium fusiforme]
MPSSRRYSPDFAAYRDPSPSSPLFPISPGSLPRWLRPIRGRSSLLGNSKVRFALLALSCIILGWMVTSALGPSMESAEQVTVYDAASGGVLGNPSGFGQKEEDGELVEAAPMGLVDGDRKPSVNGALSDLHHAVSDKIQAWNPYATKTYKTASTNGTYDIYNTTTTTTSELSGEYIADGIPDSERLGARTRIGKCTILFNVGSSTYWERAIRTHEEHDRINGYRLHVLREEILDTVWSKPAYILSLLLRELSKPEGERLDWLFWFDADTIILNPKVPIETFLPPDNREFQNINLLYSKDWNGLNNGVFPVRVNQWAVAFFSAIVSFRHYKPDAPLPMRDQTAMDVVMNEPAFINGIQEVPQRWFNAYQGEHNETLAPFQIRRGDMLVHFAGVGNREERMSFWLDRAEQHLDDWEVPVSSTSYPQERKDFWDELRRSREGKKEEVAEERNKVAQLLAATDLQLGEYGDRLANGEKDIISKQRQQLENTMNHDEYGQNMAKLQEEVTKLQNAAQPLTNAVKNGQKVLLNTAHEAIFAGEKDLLDGNYVSQPADADMQAIDNAIQRLKMLIMAPQDQWNKPMISAATNQLTEARGKFKEKGLAVAAARKKQQDQAAQDKAALGDGGVGEDAAVLAQSVAVVTNLGPATTLVQVQTVVGEAVVATVTGEAVVQTVTQEPVAVTLWTTVEEDLPAATEVAEP